MSPINLGRINMPLKIHIHLLEISQNSISPKINSKMLHINPFINLHTPAHQQNIAKLMALEEKAAVLSKKNLNSKSLYQNLVLFRRDKFLFLSSEDITIEETCLSEQTIKIPYSSSYGRQLLSLQTIITIYLSFSMGLVKNLIPIGHLL